jgi:hypothetical protein
MASKSDAYAQAAEELDRLAEQLTAQSRSELTRLIANPTTSKLKLAGKKFELGAWAETRDDDRLSVIAEIRRNFWLGASKVQVRGFFVERDGTITQMVDRDLWDHGY